MSTTPSRWVAFFFAIYPCSWITTENTCYSLLPESCVKAISVPREEPLQTTTWSLAVQSRARARERELSNVLSLDSLTNITSDPCAPYWLTELLHDITARTANAFSAERILPTRNGALSVRILSERDSSHCKRRPGRNLRRRHLCFPNRFMMLAADSKRSQNTPPAVRRTDRQK